MPCDARRQSEELRKALQRFMDARELKPTPWAEKAGLSRGVLPNFMAGRSRTLHRETLQKLADQQKVDIGELTGDLPISDPPLDERQSCDIVDSLLSEDAMNQQLIVQLLRELVAQQKEANRLLAALAEKSSPKAEKPENLKKAS